jgi:hypothetical protein
MNNVKIIRLQNDSSIIGSLEEIMEGQYILSDAMLFDLETRGKTTQIIMEYLIPPQLVRSNEVVLNAKDIVFITTPSDSFVEYYENSVDNLKRMTAEKDSFEDELQTEMNNKIKELVLQAFNDMDPEEYTIH